MRQTVLAFVLFLLAQGLYSQQNDHFLKAPPEPSKSALQSLTASTTRSVVAMNGPWEYSLDDGDTWHRVVIPACYLDFDRYLLRRSFTIPKGLIANHRWKLVAYGMQYSGSVSINGTFIVQREGLIPFDVSIPEDIQLKESNTIEVEVDNRLDYSRTLPGRRIPLDVRTYGGIVRDIFLVGTPRVWIDEVRVKQGKTPEFEVNVVSGTIRGMSVAGTGDSGVRSSVINTDQANFTVSVSVASAKPDDSTGTGSSVASAEQVISLHGLYDFFQFRSTRKPAPGDVNPADAPSHRRLCRPRRPRRAVRRRGT